MVIFHTIAWLIYLLKLVWCILYWLDSEILQWSSWKLVYFLSLSYLRWASLSAWNWWHTCSTLTLGSTVIMPVMMSVMMMVVTASSLIMINIVFVFFFILSVAFKVMRWSMLSMGIRWRTSSWVISTNTITMSRRIRVIIFSVMRSSARRIVWWSWMVVIVIRL